MIIQLTNRKVFILFTIVVTLILVGSECAAGMLRPEVEWNQTYRDKNVYSWPEYVQETTEGGYIIAATMTKCVECPKDIWVIRTDIQGNMQWSRIIGGIDDDHVKNMWQTNDNGYIISVKSWRNTNYSYIWLVKIDSEGNEEWNSTFCQINDIAKRFRQNFGRTYSSDWPESIHQTPNNNYIIMGSTRTNLDYETIWLVNLDPTGNVLWNRTLETVRIDDKVFSFDSTFDSGSIVMKRIEINNGSGFALVKLDIKGNEQWNRSIMDKDGANSIQQTEDGGYIVSGVSFLNGILLLKANPDGLEQWNRSYNGNINRVFLIQTYDGGYVIAGMNLATGTLVIKTDSNGFEQWNNTFEGIIMNVIQQTSDGGYLIAGHERIESDCFGDYIIARIDSKGNEQWRCIFQNLDVGNLFGWSKSIDQTSDSGYILVGSRYMGTSGTKDIQLIKLKREEFPFTSFTYYPRYPKIGQMVTFDASSSYSPEKNLTHYYWNFGDGDFMNTTEEMTAHSYTSEGMYTVNLTIMDNEFALHSLAKIIIVQNITIDSDNMGNTDFLPADLEVNHTEPAETWPEPEISGFLSLISTGSLAVAYFILRFIEKE